MSPFLFLERGYLLLIPWVLGMALTLLRDDQARSVAAAWLLLAAGLGMLGGLAGVRGAGLWHMVPFAALASWMLVSAFWAATCGTAGRRQAIQRGWLAWPVVAATMAAAFSGWMIGLVVLVMWPLVGMAQVQGERG